MLFCYEFSSVYESLGKEKTKQINIIQKRWDRRRDRRKGKREREERRRGGRKWKRSREGTHTQTRTNKLTKLEREKSIIECINN